ncbi:MAG: hypothetical protein NVS3B21_34190 [Acidimicrobiales bacterium]
MALTFPSRMVEQGDTGAIADCDGQVPALAARLVGSTVTTADGTTRDFDLAEDVYRHFRATTDLADPVEDQPIVEVGPRRRARIAGGALVLAGLIGAGGFVARTATGSHRVASLSQKPAVTGTPSIAAPATPPAAEAPTPQTQAAQILSAQHQALKSFLIAIGPPEGITAETGQQPEVLAAASRAADAYAAADTALSSAAWPAAVAPSVAALRDALAVQGQDLQDMATAPPSSFVALLQQFTVHGATVDEHIAQLKDVLSNS